MKKYKLLVFLLVFVLLFNLVVVKATTNITISDGSFSYGRITSHFVNFCTANSLPALSYYTLYGGEVDVSVVSDSGVNFSKSFITNNAYVSDIEYGVGSATAFQINLYNYGYQTKDLPVGNYTVQVSFKNAIFRYSDDLLLNGSFEYKFNASSSNTFYSLTGLSSTFKLVYNNDYNYTSNIASFTMQYSNFTYQYFTLLNTDIASNGALGGFHLLNYTINNNVIKCSFDNTYETMSNPHYVCYKVHGLDAIGNPIDFSGSVSFNINVDTSPKVQNYKVSYVMDGSPCIAGSGGGRLYLYIDYGSGYQLQDTSKWSATITQTANGGQDTFSYAIDTNFNTAYKLSITKIDDIDTYNYSIHVNDTGINLTGQLKVCSNDDYVFDSSGSQTSGQETDIFTLLKEIKDIFVGMWNLILSIVDFFGALLISIFAIAYSMGVAVISLLKILVDFVSSVSSVIFNRNTSYYSISSIVSLPNSFTYQGKVIALSGLWGQVDTWLKYIHDNIVIQFGGVWAVISLIYLIKKHIIVEKEEDDEDE
jgi:hypothetical protein